MKNEENWPIYYSDTVHLSNKQSNSAIVCLWTKKERIIEKINKNKYCFIGQLYSKEYGLLILLRNLLANSKIRTLIVTGIDLNESSKGLINFFEKGVDSKNKIIDTYIYLDSSLKKEYVNLLRGRIKLIDKRKLKDFSKLNNVLDTTSNLKPKGKEIVLSLPKISPPKRYPTDFSGFKIRGNTFSQAYQKLIENMMRFGYYDKKLKEVVLMNVTFFVKNFSEEDKKFLLSRKSSIKLDVKPIKTKIKGEDYSSYSLQGVECWDELKDIAVNLINNKNICLLIPIAYIEEKDLEDSAESVDAIVNSNAWDPDPHGNIVIRVENESIKVSHISQSGKILEEFSGKTAKELSKKIAKENRISMIYHALDIGAELQKAQEALKRGTKYVQDQRH